MIDKNMQQPGSSIDEVLWSAYRRNDKVAVMDCLFRRSLVGISCSRPFSKLLISGSSKRDRAERRLASEFVRVDDRVRQIPLGTLN
jgi:hypothetical protein